MTRFRLAAGIVIACVMATPAVAAPPLIGAHGDGPLRYLDRNLHIIRSSPRITRTNFTVLSPDGRRFYADGRIIATATGRTIAKLPAPFDLGGASWGTPDRLFSFGPGPSEDDGPGDVPFVVTSYSVRTQTLTRTLIPGVSMSVGGTTPEGLPRLLVGQLTGQEVTELDVVDLDAEGGIARRTALPLDPDTTLGDPRFGGTPAVSFSGEYALVSGAHYTDDTTPRDPFLVHLVDPVERRPLALPSACGGGRGPDCAFSYRFITPTLVTGADNAVARIDPATATVIKTKEEFGMVSPQPYKNGYFAAFGDSYYGADLERVWGSPYNRLITGISAVAHGRFYGYADGCPVQHGVRIVNARTGAVVGIRRGLTQFGQLGGYIAAPVSDPPC